MKKIVNLIIGCALFIAACEPDKNIVENTEYEKLTYGNPKYSYLKILNLSPNTPVVNFYLDDVKFSSRQSTTGVVGGYAYNQLFPDINYAVTSPGAHKMTAKVIPSAAADAGAEVFDISITPAAGKYYTIVPSGVYDPVAKKIPTFVTVEDISPALDSTKIFVRFLNVVSGGPTTSLIRGTSVADPKIISNVAVNTVSNWAEISLPGGGPLANVSMLFVDAANNTAIGSAVNFVDLRKGRAYTIYARGIWGVTTTPNAPTLSFYTSFY